MLVQIDLLNDCHDTVGIGGEDCGGGEVIIGWIRHQLICEFLDKFRIKAKLSEKSIIFAASLEILALKK